MGRYECDMGTDLGRLDTLVCCSYTHHSCPWKRQWKNQRFKNDEVAYLRPSLMVSNDWTENWRGVHVQSWNACRLRKHPMKLIIFHALLSKWRRSSKHPMPPTSLGRWNYEINKRNAMGLVSSNAYTAVFWFQFRKNEVLVYQSSFNHQCSSGSSFCLGTQAKMSIQIWGYGYFRSLAAYLVDWRNNEEIPTAIHCNRRRRKLRWSVRRANTHFGWAVWDCLRHWSIESDRRHSKAIIFHSFLWRYCCSMGV